MPNEMGTIASALEKDLKVKIGFRSAFAATLGFYAGQLVASVLGLLTFAAIGLGIYAVVHFIK